MAGEFGPDVPTSGCETGAMPAMDGGSGGVATLRRMPPNWMDLVTEKLKRRLCELEKHAAHPASHPPDGGSPASYPTKSPLVRPDTWWEVEFVTPAAAARGADMGDGAVYKDRVENGSLEDQARANVPAGEKEDTAETKGSDSLFVDTKKAPAPAKVAPRKTAAPKKKKATSEEAKQTKRAKSRAYMRARRAAMSKEERAAARAKWRARRAAMSKEEKEAVNEKRRECNRARRAAQSEEEKEAQRENRREYERARRAAQSEEAKEAQRVKLREYHRARRAAQSDKEKEARNARQRALRAARSKKQNGERAAKKAPRKANESVAVDEKLCAVASEMATICAGAGIKPDVAPSATSDIRAMLEPGMEECHCETDNKGADTTENA